VESCKVWLSRERYLKRFVKVTFCVFKLSWNSSGMRLRGTLYNTPFEPCGGSNVVDMDTDLSPSDQEVKESSVLICWAVLHLIMRSPLLNGMDDTWSPMDCFKQLSMKIGLKDLSIVSWVIRTITGCKSAALLSISKLAEESLALLALRFLWTFSWKALCL